VLKIWRFENLFLFLLVLHRSADTFLQNPKRSKTVVYVNLPITSTSEVLFVPGYNRWEGGGGGVEQMIQPHPKRDAWKKLRKEINKFLKLPIFSTDCSQSMGLQSVIKSGAKLQHFLRYTHRHLNDPTRVGSL
jgi:hypothetical protein